MSYHKVSGLELFLSKTTIAILPSLTIFLCSALGGMAKVNQTEPNTPINIVTKKNDKKTKTDQKNSSPESKVSKEKPVIIPKDTIDIDCVEMVNDPKKYLNKHVRFKTRFYAFTSLALDYKPAMRSSKDYLSILVLRPDCHTPLSELKLAVPMSKDNTTFNKMLGTLKDGDKIEIVGTQFSMALGDPWVDVIDLKRLEPPKVDKDDEESEVTDSDDLEKKKDIKPKDKDKLPPEYNGIKK